MQSLLIGIDIDGTLLGEDCQLAQQHLEAVHKLQNMGHTVCLVSGRPLLTCEALWQKLALQSPIVSFNGSLVYDVHKDEVIAEKALCEQDVQKIISLLQEPAHEKYTPVPSCYAGREWVMSANEKHVAHFPELYGVSITIDSDRISHWCGSSHKVMTVCAEDAAGLVTHIQQKIGNEFGVVQSQWDRFEVQNKSCNKGWGLAQLAQHLGFAQENCIAVGDNHNDSDMLKWAGCSFAMGQAAESVKECANHLLPPISEHGLAALPQQLNLIFS